MKNYPTIIYRIIKHPHHRTGTKWKAYPMYDFAHGQSDFFEGVTHSLCTLEFTVHRPLYDYFIDELKEHKDLNDNRPRQIEFNRLNLTYTVMSKRKLLALVKEGLVNGWDDPRMPTLCGYRRRGYTPGAIKKFISMIGYTKFEALNDISMLEAACREDLNKISTRVSAVINPVKLIITNYPEGKVEEMDAIDNPEDENSITHKIEFTKNLWIEREDFMENAPKKYFSLSRLGQMVPPEMAQAAMAQSIVPEGPTTPVEDLTSEEEEVEEPTISQPLQQPQQPKNDPVDDLYLDATRRFDDLQFGKDYQIK